MDSTLQLCETRDFDYPEHFKIFLHNCVEKFGDSFQENDYLFAAVYFMVLECGFSPTNLYKEFPELCTGDSFDIRKLRCIKSYSSDQFKFLKDTVDVCVYSIPLRLGNYEWECELQGVPSLSGDYIIINFILRELEELQSICLNPFSYISNNDCDSKLKFNLNLLESLSVLIKEDLVEPIKASITLNTGQGCYPHLLRLPEGIQKKIIYSLIPEGDNIVSLALTCKYFCNVITKDLKLWEKLCIDLFDGNSLNDALEKQIRCSPSDENIFRSTYFRLRKKYSTYSHQGLPVDRWSSWHWDVHDELKFS